ncbi:hypothetical protein HDU82_005904, partial [Entophlyctis luteolus]
MTLPSFNASRANSGFWLTSSGSALFKLDELLEAGPAANLLIVGVFLPDDILPRNDTACGEDGRDGGFTTDDTVDLRPNIGELRPVLAGEFLPPDVVWRSGN